MIEITHYKPINKNALMGTFSIKIEKWGNFIIRELTYFKTGPKRWIAFPSKSYEKDGKKAYFSYNLFEDQNTMKAFQDKVFKSLDEFLLKKYGNISHERNEFDSMV